MKREQRFDALMAHALEYYHDEEEDCDAAGRCRSHNPSDSPWSVRAKSLSEAARLEDWRVRCVKPEGHAGCHLGVDESIWE